MKLSKLKYNPDNPRRISPEQLDKLVKSIESLPKMMELRPIVYDPDTMHILGGNQRLAALRKMGKTEIPDSWVKSADEMTEKEKREFILRDNVQSGEWDFGVLDENFADFDLDDIGIELPDGFDSEPGEVTEDDYEQPDEIKTDIKLGDLFSLRKDGKEIHRLLCGDATKKEDVERLMGGAKADMLLTDPPYGIGYVEPKNWITKKGAARPIVGDDRPFVYTEYAIPITKCISLWGTNYYCTTLPMYAEGNYVVWAKAHSEDENKVFGSSFELCWQYPKHKQEIWYERRINMGTDENGLHPTQKPIGVMARCINYHADTSPHNILDIFLGSGSTMVACHQLNRKCYGMDIEPTYCQVTLDRMRKLDPDIEVVKIDG